MQYMSNGTMVIVRYVPRRDRPANARPPRSPFSSLPVADGGQAQSTFPLQLMYSTVSGDTTLFFQSGCDNYNNPPECISVGYFVMPSSAIPDGTYVTDVKQGESWEVTLSQPLTGDLHANDMVMFTATDPSNSHGHDDGTKGPRGFFRSFPSLSIAEQAPPSVHAHRFPRRRSRTEAP